MDEDDNFRMLESPAGYCESCFGCDSEEINFEMPDVIGIIVVCPWWQGYERG
jgi:hypothetical protein